jgi:hypothetical protein
MSASENNSQDDVKIVDKINLVQDYLEQLLIDCQEQDIPTRSSRPLFKAIWCLEDFALQLTSHNTKTEASSSTTKRVHFVDSEDSLLEETEVIVPEVGMTGRKANGRPHLTANHPQTHREDKSDASEDEIDFLKRAIRENMHFYLDGNILKVKPRDVDEQKNSATKAAKVKIYKAVGTNTPSKTRK